MILHRFMSKREYDALMAGKKLVNTTNHGAMGEMCDYFDENRGHDSIVGRIVTQSHWPDLDAVNRYLQQFKEK